MSSILVDTGLVNRSILVYRMLVSLSEKRISDASRDHRTPTQPLTKGWG